MGKVMVLRLKVNKRKFFFKLKGGLRVNSNMGVKYCFELALSNSFRMCVDRQFWLKKRKQRM
jgi:hypothetical protein